jgi:hypothetical protein
MHDITRILKAAAQADPQGAAELLPLVYEEPPCADNVPRALRIGTP